MTSTIDRTPRHLAPKERSRLAKNLLHTLPIVLVGSMAMSLNLAVPADAQEQKRPLKDKASSPSELSSSIRQALARTLATSGQQSGTPAGVISIAGAPATYRVESGDTISGIAGRYGLSTASVLALNGLGWKSVIYPGQVLTLSQSGAVKIAPPKAAVSTGRYKIVAGDTISSIAAKFGVSTQAVLTANGLGWKSIIYPGQTLAIPGKSAPASVRPPVAVTAPPASVTPPTAAVAPSRYVIKSGDTISSIATKHKVTIQAILNANDLSWSSLIYAGRTLTIPGTGSFASSGVTPMNAEMATNAAIIVSVGKKLGVSDYGLVIALSTAMQESTLRNLNWGDRDSLGLFQQRPSTGWGTTAQVTDPVYASRLFFGGPTSPNAVNQNTRGLLDIPGWTSMTVTQAAQAVQISAYPDAYAKWEASAWTWLDQLS